MPNASSSHEPPSGWAWFEPEPTKSSDDDGGQLSLSFARCFKGTDGALVLKHLRQTILDRRLGPKASDAELRFLEGQRSVIAHIISMLERSRF
jgi:hypothetical protein